MVAMTVPDLNGFNSATAVKPWRPARWRFLKRGLSVLQFGHGGEAVETRFACHGEGD